MVKWLYTVGTFLLCAIGATATLPAQAQLTVGQQQPPPPPPPPTYDASLYRYLLPPPALPKVRCEQDRLLTDTRPCGAQTIEPVIIAPGRLKRCEQDRLLTDRSPCGDGTRAR